MSEISRQHTLQRDDIVGKRIKNIYQSPWDVDADGYGSSATYIELEDGTAFELQSEEYGVAHPVLTVNIKGIDAMPSTDIELRVCIGQTVLEVLACDQWPGMGLLVSNNYLIFKAAFQHGRGWLVGPFASPTNHPQNRYELSDTVPYWQQSN
jgi:hypothetical protein